MGSVPDDAAADRPREWLALPGGRIRPVVSVPGPGGIAELLAYGAWLARLRPTCRCGLPGGRIRPVVSVPGSEQRRGPAKHGQT